MIILTKTPDHTEDVIKLFLEVSKKTKGDYPPINSLRDIYETNTPSIMISSWLDRGSQNKSFVLIDSKKLIGHIELEEVNTLTEERKDYWRVLNQLDTNINIENAIGIKRFAIHPDYWGDDNNSSELLFNYSLNYIHELDKEPIWVMLTNLVRAAAFYQKQGSTNLGVVRSVFSGNEIYCYSHQKIS